MVKLVLAGLFPPCCRHSLWNSTPGELAVQTLYMRYSYTDRSASSSLQNQLLLGSLSLPHSPGWRCHHHNKALTRTAQGSWQRRGRSQDRRPGVVVFLWDYGGTVVQRTAALLQIILQIEMCIVLPITDRVSVCCAELLRSLTTTV